MEIAGRQPEFLQVCLPHRALQGGEKESRGLVSFQDKLNTAVAEVAHPVE